ncbi:hypothetical protein GCM10029978_102490 [Actinoallomurus acanthiterrae]
MLIYPIETAIDKIRFGAAQLSKEAPTQYQEYDRLRSEADLRIAVVPPLLTLTFIVPFHERMWVVLAVSVACAALLCQAAVHTRAANEILANSIYAGYVTIPQVQSIVEYLKSLDPQPRKDGEWMGAILNGLDTLAQYDEAEFALQDLLEFNEHDCTVALTYLRAHNPPLAGQLERRLKLKEAREENEVRPETDTHTDIRPNIVSNSGSAQAEAGDSSHTEEHG